MESLSTAETPVELHPWVVMTEGCLNRTKPSDDGLIRPEKIKRLNVCVGKESVQRSMLIWDRLLKTVAASRFKIRMNAEAPCRTIVTVDGEDLSIGLKEKTTRTEHFPTPTELVEMKESPYFHGVPTWDFHPSGKLVLTIDYINAHNDIVNQAKRADGEKKRIEDRLSSFAALLLDVAKDVKESRARAEEWKRNWEEEERHRQEVARLQLENEKRVKMLEEEISNWKLANSTRDYANAVREEAIRRRGEIEKGSPLDLWLQWAEGHADKIDPLGSHDTGEQAPRGPASATI